MDPCYYSSLLNIHSTDIPKTQSKTILRVNKLKSQRSQSFSITPLSSHASSKIPVGNFNETDVSKRISKSRERQSRDRSAKSVLHFPSASLSTSQQLHYQHQHHFDFDGDENESERHEGNDCDSEDDDDCDVEMDGEILKLLELLEIEEGIKEELDWAASNNRIIDDNDDFIDDFIAHRNEDIES